MIVHCRHEGCYDYQVTDDPITKTLITPITINPPKIFFFDDKEGASDFFNEYIREVDVIDIRCKNGEEMEHKLGCTCGIVELDEEDDQPVFFYNKRNQIFLLEAEAQVFTLKQPLKKDLVNLNLTNKFIKRAKTLSREQKEKYIELGKACQECFSSGKKAPGGDDK